MTTENVFRRAINKIHWFEIEEKIPFLVGLITFVVITAFLRADYLTIPKVQTKNLSYEIYLPQNFEVMESITNTFENYEFLNGGAGGVGLPQFNRTIEAYKAHESGNTHYIDLSVIGSAEGPWYLKVEAYDVEGSKIFHTTITTIESPRFVSKREFFGGYYKVGAVAIGERNLKIYWRGERAVSFDWILYSCFNIIIAYFLGLLSKPILKLIDFAVYRYEKYQRRKGILNRYK